jgi:hypothetical protein
MQTLPRIFLLYQKEVIEKITANAASIFWDAWLNPRKPPKLTYTKLRK